MSSERRLAVRLVSGGLLLAVAAMLFSFTGLNASVGRIQFPGVVAFLGLLAVIAGGAVGVIAIVRRDERSASIFATVGLAALALLIVLAQIVFHVP